MRSDLAQIMAREERSEGYIVSFQYAGLAGLRKSRLVQERSRGSHYDGGRVAANESLIAEISARGLRRTTRQTGLDRKTIGAILNGKQVKASMLVRW